MATQPTEQLPAGITAVTHYQVDLARDYLFPSIGEAQEFNAFVERVDDVKRILPVPPENSTAPFQHDPQKVALFESGVKELVQTFDRPGYSFSALMKNNMLIGASAMLSIEEPRGALVSELVLRLAHIGFNNCEFHCALRDIPLEVLRDKIVRNRLQKRSHKKVDAP